MRIKLSDGRYHDLTPAQAAFVDTMRKDPSGNWVEIEPPFDCSSVSYLVSLGLFSDRGEGSWLGYAWTEEGRQAFGVTGDAYERFGSTATGRQVYLWRFDDAPEIWKNLSTNGGDEDWLALIPLGMDVPGFMYEGGAFACCRLERFVLPTGETVVIGSHA